jgi:branched-chain amino acid transport system ATP-binding protein
MEGRRVLQHLTVEQNLLVGAHFRKDKDIILDDMENVYGYFPALKKLNQRTAGFLSGGEMQMLLVGRALMARPKLMLFDEPSMGLAPRIVQELFERIEQVTVEKKMSVLIVEQNVRAALRIAQYGYVMENGRIMLHGTSQELQNNEDIREFYLGLGASQNTQSYRDVKHYRRRKRWLG